MKLYVHDRGVVFVGKAWEIREKLKQYNRQFEFFTQWIKTLK